MLTWKEIIEAEKKQPYFQNIEQFIASERGAGKIIYPPDEFVFNAFKMTPFTDVKVVVLGQDPYHGPGQAHGLSFSVESTVKIPPSLRNIFKELAEDIEGFTIPAHGNLTQWAKQGVLLLNTVLTVEQGKAHSHAKIGWEIFSDNVISQLNQHRQGLVFLLWGSHSQKKGQLVDQNRHHILRAPHPSPLSAHRGFLGCKHFSQTNKILTSQRQSPINWQID
ncbi:uracil-DNA glycosylase [Aliiglaciecola sp. 3_MG-2023]|uniref:uracil-DNA glycosylase n=1 Tax=Aliiglaciecola sp. 3_MG-2023 TaxID=3062644 RepID=UPI0026E124E6|nr:uracil-DNA glycosylase [Aliiglaciecola sp. 3_MG-2023]MDO6692800.1 uracil-DNA glycosylase [Aliiglaciecola sp. 3_MG-2023]